MTASVIKFPPKKSKPRPVAAPSYGPTPEAVYSVFDDALTVIELADATDSDLTFNSDGTTIHVDTVFELLKYNGIVMPPDLCERITMLLSWPDRCPPNSDYGRGSRLMLALLASKGALR